MATQDYKTPVDIANRALQLLGATRIASFTESSKNASAMLFVYDKVRKAELRRNIWRFAVRRNVLRPITQGTVLFTPDTYSAITTYSLGAIVVDSDGDWWQSKLPANLANTPAQGTYWRRYTGPDSADPWDYTGETSYFAGEIVLVPAAWDPLVTYAVGEVVQYSDSIYYVSIQGTNLAHVPNDATTYWTPYQEFIADALSGALPLFLRSPTVFLCLGSGNQLDPTTYTVTNWLDLDVASVTNLHLLYPIEAGPAADLTTRNVFRLPRGYLRQAPTDPKANALGPSLGVALSPAADDYVWEDDYIVSMEQGVIMLRFVSDFVDVASMDPMFCEGLANRLAEEVCEELNQDSGKVQLSIKRYMQIMWEARLVNAIEQGSVEPPLDTYISCRI